MHAGAPPQPESYGSPSADHDSIVGAFLSEQAVHSLSPEGAAMTVVLLPKGARFIGDDFKKSCTTDILI